MNVKVFIGSASSKERMAIACAVADELEARGSVSPKVWTSIFPIGEGTLDSLLRIVEEVDFAVVILGPDDLVLKTRPAGFVGEKVEGERWTPRDNVIFEFGLSLGALGEKRCFMLLPEEHEFLHIFTDYRGRNYRTYKQTAVGGLNPQDAVRSACSHILQQIHKEGPREINEFRAFFGTKSQAVVVYPHIVAGRFQDYLKSPPLVSLETRSHDSMNDSAYDSSWWYSDWWYSEEAKVEPPDDIRPYLSPKPETNAKANKQEEIPKDQAELNKINKILRKQEQSLEELAHFDDLRAVSAIVELCGRNKVNVLTTRDAHEQDTQQVLNTISFSIGLTNGFTRQAFDIIARETSKRVELINTGYGPPHSTVKGGTPFKFNETTYADKIEGHMLSRHAIVVRTFLREGDQANVPRFVCGGCTAAGTAATGVFLKYQWRSLLKLYEDKSKLLDQDSLAIVLEFTGAKVESAKPKIVRACFFNASDCVFFQRNEVGELIKEERAKSASSETSRGESSGQPPDRAADMESPSPTRKPSRGSRRAEAGKRKNR